ncbi:craniofacial development protein 2-like [Malaya genurostris]|uniref:craniofacial development protein 2-like n=1 Tax=Malaya genurostris TaxID=325434 RepID=UPI0026F389D5|nr:craniofacial development protein 2-like [Malaya genurostris]
MQNRSSDVSSELQTFVVSSSAKLTTTKRPQANSSDRYVQDCAGERTTPHALISCWNRKSRLTDPLATIASEESKREISFGHVTVKDRKFDIVALQEVCWKGSTVRVFRGNHTIYQSCGNTHELGTAFMVVGEMQKRVIGWWPVSDRMCSLRIKGRFFNISIINVHSPHLGSSDDGKDEFYAQLEREYDRCPRHDIKIVIGDFNAQVGQEVEFRPVVGRFSAHQQTNENGLRLIDFATSKNMAIKSTFFQHRLLHRYTWRSPMQTETQIDHVLIDGRHFSDIIDVRTYRGANIDSDHYLVMVMLRPKLSVVNNVRYRRPPRYNLDRLRDTEVATAYARHLEAALLAEEELNDAPLEDCWTRTKAAISNAAESVLGYRRKQQTRLFRDKKRHLEESERDEMEMLYRSQDTRAFYRKLNDSRNRFMPRAEMCRDKEGGILTDEPEIPLPIRQMTHQPSPNRQQSGAMLTRFA